MQNRRSFRIVETLGQGGFGTVYRADMADAGGFAKQVALKIMTYEGEATDEIARQLRDEARVLALIHHRAIVGVNSLVPLEKGWGVVMEYVDGVDLSAALKHDLPSIGASLQIVEDIAGALHAAYTTRPYGDSPPLQLVHRDIKPSNVRITALGEVKLLDFGVARAEFSSRESSDQPWVMGSERYLAPERRRGIETHSGDVYGLGIVLANMLTGKRFPFPPADPDDHARFIGTILSTVKKSLSSAADEEVRGTAEAAKLLLLEMLAFEHDHRPIASEVEQRCRRLRTHVPRPWLRDWAENAVPRIRSLKADPESEPDEDSGRVLVERTGKIDVMPLPDAAPASPAAPPKPTRSPRELRLVALAAALLVAVAAMLLQALL